MGLLRAIIEAVHGEDNRLQGAALTRLVTPLSAGNTASMQVESTIGFGELTDGQGDKRLLVNGEIIGATSHTEVPGSMYFLTLTRGLEGTPVKAHAVGSIVHDVSFNTSAFDHLRRGFLIRYAQSEDLDVIARNLGLRKIVGIEQERWRRVVQALAYLPKQTDYAIERALEAYYNDTTSWTVYRLPQKPYHVFVEIVVPAANSIRGRFVLNASEARQTTGLTTVTTQYPIRTVDRVVLSTVASRGGKRFGLTNYFTSGSFVLGTNTITLGSSPGAIGTGVLVDYTPYDGVQSDASYHYLAPDEGLFDDGTDRYAYLSDPTAALQALLDQVRPAGTQVFISVRS